MYLYRRHLDTCPHKAGGVRHRRCPCPIWIAGLLNGRQLRRSVQTSDWPEAARRMVRLEAGKEITPKTIAEAIAAWDAQLEIEPSTRRKYLCCLRQLEAFCEKIGIEMLIEITVPALDRFRASRPIARTTSLRELQQIRIFFAFCLRRGWIEENLALRIKGPQHIKPKPVEPYTTEQIAAIIGACEEVGRSAYGRARARALMLLMRYAGLRIGDAIMLARDRIRDGEILLHTQKSGTTVRLPLPGVVLDALECLPLPRSHDGKPRDAGFFFWSGVGSRSSVIGDAERALATAFRKSGVPGAHAHRFRHTLAIEILTRGGTIEDVARVLGNTPAVSYRHYAPWCASYQARITELMRGIHAAAGSKPVVHSLYTGKKIAVIH